MYKSEYISCLEEGNINALGFSGRWQVCYNQDGAAEGMLVTGVNSSVGPVAPGRFGDWKDTKALAAGGTEPYRRDASIVVGTNWVSALVQYPKHHCRVDHLGYRSSSEA